MQTQVNNKIGTSFCLMISKQSFVFVEQTIDSKSSLMWDCAGSLPGAEAEVAVHQGGVHIRGGRGLHTGGSSKVQAPQHHHHGLHEVRPQEHTLYTWTCGHLKTS